MDHLEAELRLLRKRCRRLQLWCAALTLPVAGACLAAAVGPQRDVLRADVVQARCFEVVAPDGHVWGVMEVDGEQAGVRFVDDRDPERSVRGASLGIGSDYGSFLPPEVPRAALHLFSGGESDLTMTTLYAAQKEAGVRSILDALSADAGMVVGRGEGGPLASSWIQCEDEDGIAGTRSTATPREAVLETWHEGESWTANRLRTEPAESRLQLGIDERADEDEQRAQVELTAGTEPSLVLRDASGHELLRRP